MFLKSRANSSVILAITTCLILFGSTLPSFEISNAPVATDIRITSPGLNDEFTSSTVSVGGTFVSPTNPPSITIYVNGASYGASTVVTSSNNQTTKGTWSGTVTVNNGWHQLKVSISDSNGVLYTSSQFYTNDGTAIITQIHYKQLNVEYSQACEAMIKRGDFSSCPPLEKLIPVDTSNQHVSGKFVQGKYGMIRTPPQMINAYQFYDKPTTCVDCLIDANSESQMQTIWVVPTGSLTYTNHEFTGTTVTNYESSPNGTAVPYTSTVNEQNAGLTVFHDKFVDNGCMSAEVVYIDSNTLPDTIKYLEGGCKDSKYLKTTQTVIPNHPFSFDNQYSSLHSLTYLASIFHGHRILTNEHMPTGGGLGPSNCIGKTKCPYTDPYKKVGYS